MAGKRSVSPAGWALILLAVISSLVRFGASLGLRAPWIASDEMVYATLGRSFWETGHMRVLSSAPFYGFYPVFAGLPLAGFGPAVGLTALKALQALLVSSTAVIVYCWARQLVAGRWAFAAAAMAVAMPALAYSGLIMTEATFLPVATLALWLLARALAVPSWRNQTLAGGAVTLATATRLQGLGLFPAAVVAILLVALFERDVRRLVQFGPLLVASAGGLIVLGLAHLALGTGGASLGAYQPVATGGYRLVDVLRWSYREAGDLFLLVLGVPLLAAFTLTVVRLRDRRRDPGLSALLAVALGYGTVTVVQLGAFASKYAHQLVERNLITVAPPLFVAAVVWLARGMPRPQPITSIVALTVCTPAVLLPVRHLVNGGSVPDSFMTVPLLDLANWISVDAMTNAWPVGVGLMVALVLFLPRRVAPCLAGLVLVGLVGASLLAQRSIDARAHFDRTEFFGTSSTQWIDHLADGPVAYLYNGDPLWNGVWHQLYWNTRLETLALLSAKHRTFLPGGVRVAARPDGRLLRPDRSTLQERLVVASTRLTLIGRPVKEISQGPDEPGLVLWRTNGAPTLSSRTTGGLLPDGDIYQPVKVTVYACGQGWLALTLRALHRKSAVRVSVNRLRTVKILLPPGKPRQLWVHTPPHAGGRGICEFFITPDGIIRSSTIAYKRSIAAVPAAMTLHPLGAGVTYVAMNGNVTLSKKPAVPTFIPRIGYCLHGLFLNLAEGQPGWDRRFRGATIANFIAGEGTTCSQPPAGYVRRGFATAEMGARPDTYPYYAP